MKRFALLVYVFMVFGFSVYAQENIGIKVTTSVGGILFFEGREITSIWDNDSHIIPIERPGTYTIRLRIADGREISKTVVISARGIVEVSFLMPPNNIRIGTVGTDTLPIMWDSAGSDVRYNVYYNTENHVDSAQVQRNITTTMVTLSDLQWNRTYYVWVSVTENGIEGAKSTSISQALLTTSLGQIGPGGGIIFYDKGSFSDGWQYLEVAPASTVVRAPFFNGNNNILPNTTRQEIGTGKSNTRTLVDFFNRIGSSGNAAQICNNLTYNGLNDWFLPSSEELKLVYLLKKRGLGGFEEGLYWSSSVSVYSNGRNAYDANYVYLVNLASRRWDLPALHGRDTSLEPGQSGTGGRGAVDRSSYQDPRVIAIRAF
jgi:hypothetical protein